MAYVLNEIEKKFADNIGCDVLVCGKNEGINLGLYFPEVWTKEGKVKSNGVNVFFSEKKKVYVQSFQQVKIIKND